MIIPVRCAPSAAAQHAAFLAMQPHALMIMMASERIHHRSLSCCYCSRHSASLLCAPCRCFTCGKVRAYACMHASLRVQIGWKHGCWLRALTVMRPGNSGSSRNKNNKRCLAAAAAAACGHRSAWPQPCPWMSCWRCCAQNAHCSTRSTCLKQRWGAAQTLLACPKHPIDCRLSGCTKSIRV